MPDSGSGNYNLPPGYLAVSGQTILSSQHNPPLEDLAAALNRRSFRDGRAPFTGDQNFNGNKAINAANATDPQDYVTLAQVQALIAAVRGVPIGTMIVMTGILVPATWIIGNGQTLSRAANPEYWAWVQTSGNLAATQAAKTNGQYGPGNGTTTFTVPNLYADGGYFIRPMGTGRTIGSVQDDDFEAHNHTAGFSGNAVADHDHNTDFTDSTSGGYTNRTVRGRAGGTTGSGAGSAVGQQGAGGHTPSGTVTVNNRGGSETRPQNIAYPVLIKT